MLYIHREKDSLVADVLLISAQLFSIMFWRQKIFIFLDLSVLIIVTNSVFLI